jgi:hypothetical protein
MIGAPQSGCLARPISSPRWRDACVASRLHVPVRAVRTTPNPVLTRSCSRTLNYASNDLDSAAENHATYAGTDQMRNGATIFVVISAAYRLLMVVLFRVRSLAD